MATGYHLSNLRTLLTAGFSAEELRQFCFDTAEFRPVYDQLAANTGKADIIARLLEFAERKKLLKELLAWAEQTNPAQYAEHQPYVHIVPPASSTTDRGPIRQTEPKAPYGQGGPETGDREQVSPASPPPLPLVSPPLSASSPHPPSPPAQRPLRVFLCHASGDKPAVRELYQRLRADGFDPWLDEEELLPGQDWDYEIRQAVRRAEVVLVCLSPASIPKAGYIQKEIKFVLDVADQQPEGAIFLIPLRLEPCDVPDRLSRWHWANLFEARGYERLLKALRRRVETIFPEAASFREGGHTDSAHVIPSASEESPAPPKAVEHPGPAPDVPKPPATQETPHSVRSDMPPQSPITTPPSSFIPHPSSFTITSPIHLELIRIPAGEFLMGSDPQQDKNAQADEQPQHRVYLSEYYIGKYPITNAQYAAFVKAKKHRAPEHWKNGRIPAGKENHPVTYVSWNDAAAFCEWLSRETDKPFRLPTEAEWEKAARGTDGRIYPWGNTWDKTRLNSGTGDTTPVGQYSPGGDSPYGAADMAGNAWEWCADWFDEKEYQGRTGTTVQDPPGPTQGQYRVLRGGSFNGNGEFARCAFRDGSHPYFRSWNGGFRVVVSPIQ